MNPFDLIPERHRRRIFVTLLLFSLAVMAMLMGIDSRLRTPASPSGIVSFELCAWRDACAAIVESYRDVRLEAGASLGLDYLFIPLYASTLMMGLSLAAAKREKLARSGAAVLGWCMPLAAALDFGENAALYSMLSERAANSAASWTASLCASLKFAIFVVAMAVIALLAVLPKPKPTTASA